MEMLDNAISSMVDALNVSFSRGRIIAENIANSSTPDYTAREINFEKALADSEDRELSALTTRKRHITTITPGIHQGISIQMSKKPAGIDGNNVDLDTEMVKLSENTITFNTTIEMLTRKFKGLEFSINDGR